MWAKIKAWYFNYFKHFPDLWQYLLLLLLSVLAWIFFLPPPPHR